MHVLSTFLLKVFRAIQAKNREGNDGTLTPSTTPENSVKLQVAKKENEKIVRDMSYFKQLGKQVRELTVLTMLPESSYTITPQNLHDFDLPPTLITMHEAKLIIELYRRGGRLIPKAVHKLLRLAYKLLKDLPNTTKVNIEPGDKLIVVGDLHGENQNLFTF